MLLSSTTIVSINLRWWYFFKILKYGSHHKTHIAYSVFFLICRTGSPSLYYNLNFTEKELFNWLHIILILSQNGNSLGLKKMHSYIDTMVLPHVQMSNFLYSFLHHMHQCLSYYVFIHGNRYFMKLFLNCGLFLPQECCVLEDREYVGLLLHVRA